jgi:hypothetical protein
VVGDVQPHLLAGAEGEEGGEGVDEGDLAAEGEADRGADQVRLGDPELWKRRGNSLWNGTEYCPRSPSSENSRSSTWARSNCAIRQAVREARV